jgi:diacylglycerol kinase
MPQPLPSSPRTWQHKFRDTVRGTLVAIRGDSSFAAHFAIALAVVGAAAVLRVSRTDWCLLVLCITLVMTAEFFNTAIEQLAKAISGEFHPHLRDGLDISGGAVLVASLGAAVVGIIVFLPYIGRFLAGG